MWVLNNGRETPAGNEGQWIIRFQINMWAKEMIIPQSYGRGWLDRDDSCAFFPKGYEPSSIHCIMFERLSRRVTPDWTVIPFYILLPPSCISTWCALVLPVGIKKIFVGRFSHLALPVAVVTLGWCSPCLPQFPLWNDIALPHSILITEDLFPKTKNISLVKPFVGIDL